MSKLDEILEDLRFAAEPDVPGPDAIYMIESEELSYAKAHIKAVILELIGDDLPMPVGPRAQGKTYALVGNRVKAELREKVEEL